MAIIGIGQRIKELADSRGLSAYELASKLEVKPSLVYAYFKESSKPSADSLINLSKVLDVSIDWLLKGEEIKTKKAEIITDPDLEFAIQLLTDLYTSQGPDMRGWAKITFNNAFEAEIAKKKKDSTAGIA